MQLQASQLGERAGARRDRGIALLLVMILFVVLYLVVSHLHFSTSMEAKIAAVRYGEVEAAAALYSAGLYVMTVLNEDLKRDLEAGAGGDGMPAGDSAAAAGIPGLPGMGPEMDLSTLTGENAALTGGAAGGRWYDYLRENIFLDNEQNIGNIAVKIRTRDTESRLDLNRLFDYVRLPGEEFDGVVGLDDEDLLDAVEGRTAEEAAQSLRDRVLSERRDARAGGGIQRVGEGEGDGSDPTLPGDGYGDELSAYDPPEPPLPPLPERVQATQEMLRRAILMLFSLNENRGGYTYDRKYFPDQIASEIVAFVLERQQSLEDSRVHVVTELLTLESITPEVFYGPIPQLADGDEFETNEGHTLRHDEFGDFVLVDPFFSEDDLEMQREQLESALSEFGGPYANLPMGTGFDRLLANGLTRGMSDPLIEMDENGEEIVIEPRLPLGLRDLFCTESAGKINLNTVGVEVLFGLLGSLTEDEADGVATNIEAYRNRFQEVASDEEGVERMDAFGIPDLGQPRREPPPTDEELAQLSTSLAAGEYVASTYEDLETNYFTSLEQLELIDGHDGGPEDLLRRDDGVDRVSGELDSLYRRVQNDLEKVGVFGSTHFEVKMSAKTEQSRSLTRGTLLVRRDLQRGMMEVLFWQHATN